MVEMGWRWVELCRMGGDADGVEIGDGLNVIAIAVAVVIAVAVAVAVVMDSIHIHIVTLYSTLLYYPHSLTHLQPHPLTQPPNYSFLRVGYSMYSTVQYDIIDNRSYTHLRVGLLK